MSDMNMWLSIMVDDNMVKDIGMRKVVLSISVMNVRKECEIVLVRGNTLHNCSKLPAFA